MARTRRSKAELDAARTDTNVEHDSLGQDGQEESEIRHQSESPSTFKTSLERFQYGASIPSINSATADFPSVTKASRKRRVAVNGTQSSSASPSPAKRRRISSKYAPPSKYAHLPPLQDILEPNLLCVFVGTNPGIRTATAGHAYAHPSNLFWKLLHSSGCTPDARLSPSDDGMLPRWYGMGNTNIVDRPSKDAGELSKSEMAAGTPVLEEKVRKYRPEAVCIVGKGIWEAVWRSRYGREIRKDEFKWGWQDDGERMGKPEPGDGGEEGGGGGGGGGEEVWKGARVYVTSSTSGLSASLRPHEKEAIWRPFGEWVRSRRRERFGTEGRIDRICPEEERPGEEVTQRGLPGAGGTIAV